MFQNAPEGRRHVAWGFSPRKQPTPQNRPGGAAEMKGLATKYFCTESRVPPPLRGGKSLGVTPFLGFRFAPPQATCRRPSGAFLWAIINRPIRIITCPQLTVITIKINSFRGIGTKLIVRRKTRNWMTKPASGIKFALETSNAYLLSMNGNMERFN